MTPSGPAEWYSYFWPGSTVLRNKLGITDSDELQELEHRIVELRAREIQRGSHPIDRTLDADHLRRIHAHLFGGLYDWAGEYRTVNISKTGTGGIAHHFGDHRSMDMYLRQITALISSTPWVELDRQELADRLGNVHTQLNFAHPFREGNGRSTRVFMRHLAEYAGHNLAFGRIDARDWNTASAATFLHPHGLRLDSAPFAEIYRDIIVTE